MSTYSIATTLITYVLEGDIYKVKIIDLETNEVLEDWEKCVLQISVLEESALYSVELCPDGSYPDAAQKVVLDPDEEGVMGVGFNVQNRAGLGTVDFRDCGRLHTWQLDEAPVLYLANYPSRDLAIPSLWVGVGEEYIDAAYSYSTTCD